MANEIVKPHKFEVSKNNIHSLSTSVSNVSLQKFPTEGSIFPWNDHNITGDEAKKEYGVAESTVRTAIRSGRMPAVRADNSGRAKWLIPKGFKPKFMSCKNPEYRAEALHEAHINVNLGKSLHGRLMEYVGKNDVRRSDVFRGALDEFLTNRGF